ncbi:aspartate--tRNA ligase [Fusibacter tunisiensis]|uniref:Aspartate--tRNA ligase n=1 Tax=Fusibacter tunisiensis TaxID=1008308 RepID=A0ABS2MQD7_9FIRM|nr:aspartate--tRNA ligase [Fusibacter tunisiensis]MBM7561611.1 aspartyl-tRNA synthetase [Fusibacter tunisiensis]
MGEALNGMKRTHYCGDVRESHIDTEVVLMGWVQKRRNLGSLIFVDLRDRTGICQVVFDTAVSEEAFEKASTVRGEYVLAIRGTVKKRESINPNIPTGMIEIFVSELKILCTSDVPPIHIDDQDEANERLRLKYRYLDLRKGKMQRNLMMRHQIASAARRFYDENGFIEVETPVLTKPTPEGARDYLVPSRVNPNKFYALPQSPQLFKQLLMVSGMDRYYQITKCFRDEDLRADRQPEFTQIDVEMSFVDEDDVIAINEKMLASVYSNVVGIDVKIPFQRLTYQEAMERYGSDKPDTRFGFELKKLNTAIENSEFKVFSGAIGNGGDVRAINVKGYADRFSRKDITNLETFCKTYGAKGLAWMKIQDNEIQSPIAKFLSEKELADIQTIVDAEPNDLILIVADQPDVVFDALGALRVELAKQLNLLDPKIYHFLWVTDFPLFEYDDEAKRYVAKHHPFTAPKDEDLEKLNSNPGACRAKAYDIVLNGYEIGGGSIRIHDSSVQERMFEALGFTEEEANEKFGFFIDAFKYGAPPHGGIAYGLDRMVMLAVGTDNIRDVIAFPKTQDAKCLMTNAPSVAEDQQLEELYLKLKPFEKQKGEING